MHPKQQISKHRIEILDILRGLAASVVIFHHIFFTVPALTSIATDLQKRPWWGNFIFLGDLSVILFFVLSGTSLAIAFQNGGSTLEAKSFFIKRFFRVYPLYATSLILYFMARPVYQQYLDAGYVNSSAWMSQQFILPVTPVIWLTHLTMVNNVFNIPDSFNNASWSLPVEMQFYLVFPLLIFLFLKLGRVYGTIAAAMIGIVAAILGYILHSPFTTIWPGQSKRFLI